MNRRFFALAGASALIGVRSSLAQSATPAAHDDSSEALYRVDVPGDLLPKEPVLAGVIAVSMTAGTTVTYPEGSAPESLAIDHVLTGGYTLQSNSDVIHRASDGSAEEVPGGTEVDVSAGETVVLIENEAEQIITVGDEDTETLTAGLFTQNQGTNESTVDGELVPTFLGAAEPLELPSSGVTVMIVPDTGDASTWPDAVVRVAFETEDGNAWELVILPLAGSATPAATPAS